MYNLEPFPSLLLASHSDFKSVKIHDYTYNYSSELVGHFSSLLHQALHFQHSRFISLVTFFGISQD